MADGRRGTPYHRIEIMKPGECWSDMADTSCKYTEHYVEVDGRPIPVGVMIARELKGEGAAVAVCTDLTLGRLRFVNVDLICIEPEPLLSQLLDELRPTRPEAACRVCPTQLASFPMVASRSARRRSQRKIVSTRISILCACSPRGSRRTSRFSCSRVGL